VFVSVNLVCNGSETNERDVYYRISVECLGQYQTVTLLNGEPQKLVFDGAPQAAKVSRKRQRRAATKQEEQVAQLHGGHRHRGSGTVSHKKGDARIRHRYRIENKYTTKEGIRLKREDLLKIRSECTPGECPVFQIDFKAPGTLKTEDQWVLVPLKEWERKIATPDD